MADPEPGTHMGRCLRTTLGELALGNGPATAAMPSPGEKGRPSNTASDTDLAGPQGSEVGVRKADVPQRGWLPVSGRGCVEGT